MRPVTLTLTGNGATPSLSAPCPMDIYENPFNVGMGFNTNGNTTGFTVQHCFEDPWSYASADLYNANAKWFSHPTMAAMVADEDGNYAFSVRAIRLAADANGTDVGQLTIIQSTGR